MKQLLTTFNFSKALDLLKLGKKICRVKWKEEFLVLIEDPYNNNQFSIIEKNDILATLDSFIMIKMKDNRLMPYSFTQDDILSSDWMFFD